MSRCDGMASFFCPGIPRGGRMMDRLDAMKVFVVALDEGSLAAAGRKLGRSPAAVSRAIAFLEGQVGAELLHRTTRSIKLSEEGERYAAACRRVLSELEGIDVSVGGGQSAPRGTLTLTAPVLSGELVLRPILDAFLDATPTVSARLFPLFGPAGQFDRGRHRCGAPHRSPRGLRHGRATDRRGTPGIGRGAALPETASTHPGAVRSGQTPDHRDGSYSHIPRAFPQLPGSAVPRTVQFAPRLVINSIRGAVASAVGGRGVALLFLLPGSGACAAGRAR